MVNRPTSDQIFCIRQILERAMEVQWDGTLVINRLWESLRRTEERIIVQYSHWIGYTYEARWDN
jgi:hypothetical protein